jgi:hypothetical protein
MSMEERKRGDSSPRPSPPEETAPATPSQGVFLGWMTMVQNWDGTDSHNYKSWFEAEQLPQQGAFTLFSASEATALRGLQGVLASLRGIDERELAAEVGSPFPERWFTEPSRESLERWLDVAYQDDTQPVIEAHCPAVGVEWINPTFDPLLVVVADAGTRCWVRDGRRGKVTVLGSAVDEHAALHLVAAWVDERLRWMGWDDPARAKRELRILESSSLANTLEWDHGKVKVIQASRGDRSTLQALFRALSPPEDRAITRPLPSPNPLEVAGDLDDEDAWEYFENHMALSLVTFQILTLPDAPGRGIKPARPR